MLGVPGALAEADPEVGVTESHAAPDAVIAAA
jgi:hypothetical protein